MLEVGAGLHLEEFRGQLERRRARPVVHRAGLALGERHQFLHRGHADGRVHRQHERERTDHRHRREVLHRVVGQLVVEAGIEGHRPACADEQRVAVGRGLRDKVGADDRVRARLVLDDEGLPEPLLQLRADQAPEDVVGAPGRKPDDEAHGLGRVGVRGLGVRGECRGCQGCEQQHCLEIQLSLLGLVVLCKGNVIPHRGRFRCGRQDSEHCRIRMMS